MNAAWIFVKMYRVMYKFFILIFLSFFLGSCSSSDHPFPLEMHKQNQKGEYLYRKHDEYHFKIPPPEFVKAQQYVWETNLTGGLPKITKEYFRCKGSHLNPARIVPAEKEAKYYYDCGGSEKHSLPLKAGEEFIYPILIDLLNELQEQTHCKVVITCGHSCPEHHTYADLTNKNLYSKHMIGAEVAFYVQGMETSPEVIAQLIQDFYKKQAKYENKKEYTFFQTYEKDDAGVSTKPLYNKEIFLKIYKEDEGRNFDNRHPYPYLAIQVRYDFDLKTKVVYTWNLAHRNYLRW
jgi:hypothetical protein